MDNLIRDNGSIFIVLEGMNGAGKTTAKSKLRDLWDNGRLPCFDNIITTFEPGGTAEGDHIRHLFKDFMDSGMDGRTELLLINAARRHHLDRVIFPGLSEKATLVICDRYLPSTYAFQHGWRGVPESDVLFMHAHFCYGFQPDFTIYFDIDPQTTIKRTSNRAVPISDTPESIEILTGISRGYNKYFIKNRNNVSIVNANESEELVWQSVLDALRPVFPKGIIT